jgi:IS30 family transposase
LGKHITEAQRYQIEALLQQGLNGAKISESLEVEKSVIYREISRNRLSNGTYKAVNAQIFYEHSRKKCRKKRKVDDENLMAYIKAQIKEDKSPEQISGTMKTKQMEVTLSHESIYQYIWSDKKNGGELHKHLRNKGRRYRKRGNSKDSRGIIKDRVPIDLRPKEVDEKSRIGDLEIDLIIGANHQQAILTVVERKSGMAWLRKLKSKSAQAVEEQLIDILFPIRKHIHTITSDNGKEFALHKNVSKKLKSGFYFARPYHSWERGCNENYNRLVRQYFPKKSDFTIITNNQLQEVQNKLNNRERKRLGFLSPIQYLYNHSLTKVAFAT